MTPIDSKAVNTSRKLGREATAVDQHLLINFASALGQGFGLSTDLTVEGISGRLPFCRATAIWIDFHASKGALPMTQNRN
jgi:hypothetical protein